MIHVNRINDRVMLLKLLVGKRVVVIISYAPQQSLSDEAKESFYADMILHISEIDGKEIIILGADLVALDMGLEMQKVSVS